MGKTTAIREVSRALADELLKRVVIVDTSNEIGGDGDIPHEGIGRARRIQVPHPEAQHRVMIEAVENHMPEVVVIDEIGTEQECVAARTIAQRGAYGARTSQQTTRVYHVAWHWMAPIGYRGLSLPHTHVAQVFSWSPQRTVTSLKTSSRTLVWQTWWAAYRV